MKLYNVLLTNLHSSWFSLTLHDASRIELKNKCSHLVKDVEIQDANYYKQFVPLGLSVNIDEVLTPKSIHMPNVADPKVEDTKVEEVATEELIKEDDVANATLEPELPDRHEPVIQVSPSHDSREYYESLTKNEIRDMLKDMNVGFKQSHTKEELIDMLMSK